MVAQIFEFEMPGKCFRLLTKIKRVLAVDRSPSAAAYFVLVSLLLPNFAAAQSPQKTEAVEVLDANSVRVATLIVPPAAAFRLQKLRF
jgi:hypothetical protein